MVASKDGYLLRKLKALVELVTHLAFCITVFCLKILFFFIWICPGGWGLNSYFQPPGAINVLTHACWSQPSLV